jgi:hypothetical protein
MNVIESVFWTLFTIALYRADTWLCKQFLDLIGYNFNNCIDNIRERTNITLIHRQNESSLY